MLIAKAHAQAVDLMEVAPEAPGAGQAFMWNVGMVLVLVVLFYVLLILPQQRRFKEHSQMLAGLKKGDKVVTGGGLIGKVDKISEDSDEVTVDLGGGQKVTALRSTLSGRSDLRLSGKGAKG